jgi:predicted esterase
VDPQAPVFTGFSLGAILGVHLLSAPDALPRVQSAVLTEGGYAGWHKARAEAFVARGGARVLFACGQSACRQASKQTEKVLEKQGVQVEIASGGDIGHTYDGAVAQAIRERWAWLTEGDARFASKPSAAPATR